MSGETAPTGGGPGNTGSTPHRQRRGVDRGALGSESDAPVEAEHDAEPVQKRTERHVEVDSGGTH
nr:hypothetical protein PDK3.065 [Rhodococcus sp. DK17]